MSARLGHIGLLIGAVGFAGALDSYTANLWFAGGLKRLLTSYTGPLIRVRKTTGGDTTTEQNIGYLVDGSLDTTALASFAGAETAVIVKTYDQSGAANDLGQTTGSKQPRIVNAGSYDGFIRFDGTDDGFQSVNNSGTPSCFTVAWKCNSRANTVTKVLYEHGPTAGNTVGSNDVLSYIGDPGTGAAPILLVSEGSGNYIQNYWGSSNFPSANVHMSVFDRTVGTQAGDAILYISGSLIARSGGSTTGSIPGSGTNYTANKWNIGARDNASSLPSSIDIYTMAIYEANKSSDAAGIATALA